MRDASVGVQASACVGVHASACAAWSDPTTADKLKLELQHTLKRELQPALTPLTSLRFLAASLVLLFHALDSFPQASVLQLPRPMLNVLESGFIGVSVFFILSGFILGYNYLAMDFAPPRARRQFWAARFARIYPVYLLGMVLAAPKFFTALSQTEVTGKAKEAALEIGRAHV